MPLPLRLLFLPPFLTNPLLFIALACSLTIWGPAIVSTLRLFGLSYAARIALPAAGAALGLAMICLSSSPSSSSSSSTTTKKLLSPRRTEEEDAGEGPPSNFLSVIYALVLLGGSTLLAPSFTRFLQNYLFGLSQIAALAVGVAIGIVWYVVLNVRRKESSQPTSASTPAEAAFSTAPKGNQRTSGPTANKKKPNGKRPPSSKMK